MDMAHSWESADFSKQLSIARAELDALKAGKVAPVFGSLLDLLKMYIPKGRSFTLLDCACAAGYYYDLIQSSADLQIQYTGSDLAPAAIELARSRHPAVEWHAASITALPFGDASFDIVMASGVLEHVPAWETALAEMARVARQYVIMHRLPISPSGQFQDGAMEMYGIPTVRYSFAFHEIIEMMQGFGFILINSIDTYHTHKIPEQTVLFKRR